MAMNKSLERILERLIVFERQRTAVLLELDVERKKLEAADLQLAPIRKAYEEKVTQIAQYQQSVSKLETESRSLFQAIQFCRQSQLTARAADSPPPQRMDLEANVRCSLVWCDDEGYGWMGSPYAMPARGACISFAAPTCASTG